MDELVKIPENVNLSETEKSAYVKYLRENKPALSPKTALEFFELFLNGSNCEDIAKLNPSFGLGIIVKARIDFRWDEKKDEYINNLYSTVREKLTKSQLEAIEFSALSLSTFHKLWGTKFKKFLQTGNEDELGDIAKQPRIAFKVYKELSENLLKITGQDKKQQVVTGEVVHKVEMPPSNKAMTPKDAADILKIVDAQIVKK